MSIIKNNEVFLPSKEIISQVLYGYEIDNIHIVSNDLIFEYSHYVNGNFEYRRKSYINIYEFSEKCRKWAKEQSYILMIFGSVVYIIPDNFDADYFKFLNYKSFSEKTINESIFAACEWIFTKDK